MTKKLLLAASAVAAMSFAAAAQAGTITQVSVGKVAALGDPTNVVTLVTGTAQPVPYTIASERIVNAANPLTGDVVVETKFDTAISPAATHTVIFTIAGGEFATGAPTVVLLDGAGAIIPDLNAARTATRNLDGSISVVFSTAGANTPVASVRLTTQLISKSQDSVRIAQRTVSGTSFLGNPVDSIASTEIVKYAPLLRNATATPATRFAALQAYTTFVPVGLEVAPVRDVSLATQVRLNTNTTTAATHAGNRFYRDLDGREVAAADIVNSASVTVNALTGSQLGSLNPHLIGGTSGTTIASNTTPTTARFNGVNFADLTSVAGFNFRVSNPQATAITLDESSYAGAIVVAYNSNYTGVNSFAINNLGAIDLEGTQFTAPWFTLNSTVNESTLRIGNHASAATGLVYVTVRARNNGTAPTTSRVEITNGQGIPAGGVLTITGPQLATLLGTTAQNADLRVTVQGQASNLTGKVRVRNFQNQSTFEQSLGRVNGGN